MLADDVGDIKCKFDDVSGFGWRSWRVDWLAVRQSRDHSVQGARQVPIKIICVRGPEVRLLNTKDWARVWQLRVSMMGLLANVMKTDSANLCCDCLGPGTWERTSRRVFIGSVSKATRDARNQAWKKVKGFGKLILLKGLKDERCEEFSLRFGSNRFQKSHKKEWWASTIKRAWKMWASTDV